jgi:peptidyl-prolyl cis-trans isomerase C
VPIAHFSWVALLPVLLLSIGACRKASDTASATGASPAPSAQATPEPAKPMPAQLPDVLARVNGQDVMKTDFDMLVRNMELSQGPIPAERRDEILRSALDQLVAYTLLQQEAKARNLTVSDAEVNERLKAMQGQFPTEEEFKKALASRSMTVERLRDDARVDMVITRLMDSEVASAEPATDADCQEFYEKNPDKFKRGEAVRASHILIMANETADEATRKKARAQIDAVHKRARAGEDFAKLAQAHSQDGSAAQGGDLNFFERGRMVPPFEEAAFALKPGEISDVVTTQFGYHVIKVTERREASAVPLDEVRDRVREFLTNQKKQQRADAFIASLKQKSKIEVLI